MIAKSDVETLLECFQRIYSTCHVRNQTLGKMASAVSANQASVLDNLSTTKGVTVLNLASRMGVAPSTMSLTLDRLERGSFIKRIKDTGDGRRTFVFLTLEGDRIQRGQKMLEPERIAALLGTLPPGKRKPVVAGLRTLLEAASNLR